MTIGVDGLWETALSWLSRLSREGRLLVEANAEKAGTQVLVWWEWADGDGACHAELDSGRWAWHEDVVAFLQSCDDSPEEGEK